MINTTNSPLWHPFTQMKTAPLPIRIMKAKDALLYDDEGRTYIDAISSWWVTLHGHANEHISKRIAEQASTLEQVIFAGFTHDPALTLAKKLISLVPGNLSKVFFTDDGSTAVETAIKMALQYWSNLGHIHKTKIIAFENAYHGDTFGAMSVGERSGFTTPFQRHLFDVIRLPVPTEDTLDEVKKMFLDYLDQSTLAAFIFEPLVQGAGGMLMHKPEHLNQLIVLAKNRDIPCIADEVMTGFGRTGKNFAMEYLSCTPDIVCLSKGITGGFLPLGATLCSEQIYHAFHDDDIKKTFFHGHSYTANPIACAAANASIELLLEKKCQQQITMISNEHKNFIQEIKKNKLIQEARSTGTILAIELDTEENSSYFNSIKERAYPFYIKHGVLMRPLGNIVYVMPPYCITQDQLAKIYGIIEESLYYLHKL